MTSAAGIDEATRWLQAAYDDRLPCPPVRNLLPNDIDAAYEVQARLVGGRIAAGARLIGRKIGLTNLKVQEQLGVDQPDFGVLLDDMRCPMDEPISTGRLLQPRIEGEIAFVLGSDLDRAGPITDDDVVAATHHVSAALEIVDSRVAGWDIAIVDTIADNGSSGLFVIGDQQVSLVDIDVVMAHMTMRRGTDLVSTGTGADCLGSPIAAVAWLANVVRDRGSPLLAGEVILSGALGPMVAVEPGSSYAAEISGLGTVTARFAGHPSPGHPHHQTDLSSHPTALTSRTPA